MSRISYYLFLLSVQIVIAIMVYVSLSSVPSEETNVITDSEKSQQVFFSYEEENGTQEWVSVNPSYYACGGGYEQSPINITRDQTQNEEVSKKIELKYKPTKFLLQNSGHSMVVNDPSGNNILQIDGEEFKLVQIHFHSPSEHQLNGQTFNMEGQLIHVNKEGQIAVVGFFIREGKINTDLVEMWSVLPTESTDKPIEVNHMIDWLEVLPKMDHAYQYSGSLTIPPCTEGVTWLLFEKPIEMSSQQIETFANIYPQNNRPIQEINNRTIYKLKLE